MQKNCQYRKTPQSEVVVGEDVATNAECCFYAKKYLAWSGAPGGLRRQLVIHGIKVSHK